jgi:FKBP-type peptidyl-prolyl cis-trans isomerase
VLAHYKGWIKDENQPFDSSYERGEPLPCSPAGGVIQGWMEGLTYVGEGGMIEMEIPPELGYGARDMSPDIPPNSTLHFIMEVVEVK